VAEEAEALVKKYFRRGGRISAGGGGCGCAVDRGEDVTGVPRPLEDLS
jgi:hypothetical protein